MNCFEARQEFPALWRNRGTTERRSEILEHLKGCAKCDHAFRVFALTAPVLHSESEPQAAARVSARREFSLADRPQRFSSVSREATRPRRWVAVAAAAAIFVIAGSAAFYSVDAPRETLSEELSIPEANDNYEAAAADPLAPEMPMTESDLAS